MLSGKLSAIQDFKTWLHRYDKELKDLPPSEVAYRAIANGFDTTVVRQWEHSKQFENMGERP